jgi:hypothetical protein
MDLLGCADLFSYTVWLIFSYFIFYWESSLKIVCYINQLYSHKPGADPGRGGGGGGGGGGGAPGVCLPPKIGKNKIFWRKIVIFHTKTPNIFVPPSARCNFFKCAPLTWNPGSAPVNHIQRYREDIIIHITNTE